VGDNATTWPLLASGLVSGGFFSIFNFTCGILPLGQGAIPVRCPTPPSAAVRRVDGGSSFLFGNPFICGTLLVGKVSSFGEGLFYRTAPTGYFVPRSVGAFFFLASGLHELIRGVSWRTHSYQFSSWIAPIGIESMGVFLLHLHPLFL